MTQRLYICVDPSLANTGIVGLNEQGRVALAENITTEPCGSSREALFERWEYIADEAERIFYGALKPVQAVHRFLVYAPLHISGRANPYTLLMPCVNGILYGIVRPFSAKTIWRDDTHVRGVMRQAGYDVPKGKKKGDMTRFVREYWPECKNSHQADAFLGAKYLMLGR